MDAKNWTDNGVNQTILAQGLSLQNAQTYYVSVITKSNFNLWSSTGVSAGITVDLIPPAVNGVPSVSQDGSTYMVTWPAAQTGVSGVAAYELQQRIGTSPVWVTVSSFTLSAAPALLAAKKAPGDENSLLTSYVFNNLPDGTYFFRVSALNGAGVWSNFTPAARVVVGAVSSEVLSLVSAYPNPFHSKNAKVDINYTLNQNSNITIKIYDLYGHFVNEIDCNSGSNGGILGSNDVMWDGTDKNGSKVSMGGYIVKITSDADGPDNAVVIKIGVVH